MALHRDDPHKRMVQGIGNISLNTFRNVLVLWYLPLSRPMSPSLEQSQFLNDFMARMEAMNVWQPPWIIGNLQNKEVLVLPCIGTMTRNLEPNFVKITAFLLIPSTALLELLRIYAFLVNLVDLLT